MTERLGMGKGHLTSLVRLSLLAPDIVRALLKGRQPIELTPTRLLRLSKDLPHDWIERDKSRHLPLSRTLGVKGDAYFLAIAPLIKPLPSDNYFGGTEVRLGCWTIQTACTCIMHVAAPRPREGLLSEVRHAVEGPRSGHPTAKCRLPHPWRGGARLRGLKAWS